ncbi:Protein transport protein S9 plasma membrane t-SNARE [Taxawa tesnikishii (nom. ined.)]|nr:Protein transport protein S9 plasma membrane t-SNARE [Dothideales sp. JES 119]
MPFGFSKKDKDVEEEKARSSLFGSRSKSSKAAVPQANPYAQQPPSSDPYAAKSASNSAANLSAPPAYDNRAPSPLRNEKSPVPPGGYGGGYGQQPPPQRDGYGNSERFTSQGSSSYGQQSGYGSNPYGREPAPSRYGPAGYGGMATPASGDASYTGGSAYGDNSYGGDMPGSYGRDPNRELTAEEQEEEDVSAAKSEIRFLKQQDVASTRNARRIAEQAEATGRETLARLGAQGERIHNTERNLDMASNQNRLAEEKARELKTLNRSMFAVHVSNPFTAKKREEAANAIALEKHQRERAQADATRKEAWSSKARRDEQGREFGNNIRQTSDKASLAQRAKYQFEADSEDDEMENEIDNNLEAIHRGARTLNQLGQAMGKELDAQNKHIDRIIGKTDKVDDQIAMNRERLNRIR